jgi:hypothetical protein
VFGGMILSSFIGIFAIPPLYVMFQTIREKLRPSSRPRKPSPPQSDDAHDEPYKAPPEQKGIAAE